MHGQCLRRALGLSWICVKGPNIEVREGGKSKVVCGVKNFKKAIEFLDEEAPDVTMTNSELKFSKIKFAARREEELEKRLAKIKEAWGALGGESRAVKEEPKRSSQLLVIGHGS